jgi:uncharacterized membrane protein
VLYLAVLIITGGFNVPLNDRLAAAGAADRIHDLHRVRESFESSWVRWNVVRSVASLGAFVSLVIGLVAERATTSSV